MEIKHELFDPDYLAKRIVETEAERTHLSKGLSSHGKCLGQQILGKIYQKPFTGQGATTPGTAYHKYMQELVLPSGKQVGQYLIIGHEQYIFLLDDQDRIIRQSPIDTLAYNLDHQRFEIWDYKSTSIDLKYIRKIPTEYEAQINLYAQAFKHAHNLSYNPVCKIIYASKDNWMDLKIFGFESRPDLMIDSQKRVDVVDQMGTPAGFAEAKSHWAVYAEGIQRWSDTKVPYRKECKYCDYQSECLQLLNAGTGQECATVDDWGNSQQ